jgi:hypothetical protein
MKDDHSDYYPEPGPPEPDEDRLYEEARQREIDNLTEREWNETLTRNS